MQSNPSTHLSTSSLIARPADRAGSIPGSARQQTRVGARRDTGSCRRVRATLAVLVADAGARPGGERLRFRAPARLRARHLGLAGGDDRSRLRPAGRHPRERRQPQRPDLDHQHRRLHVERRGRAARGLHLAPRARRPAVTHARDARGDGALRGHGPVLQLVRPPHRREAHHLAAGRDQARLRSCPRSTTPGSRSASRSWPSPCRRCRGARGRSTRRWTSASTTGPRSTACCSTSAPTTRGVALLLRHARQREPHRRLHRHRPGPAAAAGPTTGAGAPSRTPATTPSRKPSRWASRAATRA